MHLQEFIFDFFQAYYILCLAINIHGNEHKGNTEKGLQDDILKELN